MFTESQWPIDDAEDIADTTVGELLEVAARNHSARTALIAGTVDPAARREWDYASLLEDARSCARGLLKRFDTGEHVAVWAPNVPEWVVLEFGAALAGLTLVTINPAFTAAETEFVLRHSHAAGIVHAEQYRGHDYTDTVARLGRALPSLREAIPIGKFEQLLEEGDSTLPMVSPDDPLLILYTSGTTGFPKGAVLRHRAVANNARFCAERARFAGGAWLNPLPLFHAGGCVNAVLGPLWSAGVHVLVESFDPPLVLELAERTRAQVMGSVPTMMLALMEHPEFRSERLESLQTILSGGSTVPEQLCERIESEIGCRFSIVYGQTETSSVVTQVRPEDSRRDKATTVGQPLPQVECKVVDTASGAIVPVRTPGELCVRGYQTMVGYFEDSEATKATIDDEGWLHTGDLAVMDERGYFAIVGRLKDLVIRGGENIWPREIEEVLFGHEEVAEAVVVGIPDEHWGEVVAAVVRTKGDPMPSAAELSEYCRQELARHKVPARWFHVDAFPMTASGKVQKFVLRDLIVAGELRTLD